MRKNKLLLLLALLLTAATGAWAEDPKVYDSGEVELYSLQEGDILMPGVTLTNKGNKDVEPFLNSNRFSIDGVKRTIASRISSIPFSIGVNGLINAQLSGTGPNMNSMPITEDGKTGNAWVVTRIYTVSYRPGYKEIDIAGTTYPEPKHLITATYREQTRSLEQPLPYATTIGELYESVTGEQFSNLISTMSGFDKPLTGITSNNTSVVSIGELNGASTPVTVNADGKATVGINFGSYALGIFVSVTSPLYANMKDGVKDADKWTVKVGEGQAQALPIGGLKGDGSETVTLQYNGRLKVKGVKATSEAAAPSVPEGAISGVFSVSATKQVYFSKGNLRYASGTWSFFDNQYDYYTSYSADAWDHLGWSTSATDYGMNTSTSKSTYSGDFVDWGATMGTGWFTLSSDEWTYLFNTRSASTVGGTSNGRYAKAKVNDVKGVILFPDTYTLPDGVTAPTNVNTASASFDSNTYTVADWTKMESAGCVFLPATDSRNGSSVNFPSSHGYYWSATPNGTERAYRVHFSSDDLNPADINSRYFGYSVRLVQEVATNLK